MISIKQHNPAMTVNEILHAIFIVFCRFCHCMFCSSALIILTKNPFNKNVFFQALTNFGAKAVSAYVTHAVFPNNAHMKFIEGDVKFENFFITDSVPHAYEIAKHPPFKLLSLCDVIADALWGYDLMQY